MMWHNVHFDTVVQEFLDKQQALPILDQAAQVELLTLLPIPIPVILLPDIWKALLKLEFELLFLHFWDGNGYYEESYQFEHHEVEKFRGSQRLYPFVKARWRDHCFEEECKVMIG